MNKVECVCPVCNGTKRMPTPDHLRKYAEAYGWYGYQKDDDCCTCTNCGGQTMYGEATGKSFLRSDGITPCTHEYKIESRGRCYTVYTCIHCEYSYGIDSSD